MNNRFETNLEARAFDILEELTKLGIRNVVLREVFSYLRYLKRREQDPDKYKGFLDVTSELINRYKKMPEALDAILHLLLGHKYPYLIKHARSFLREDVSKVMSDVYQIAKRDFVTRKTYEMAVNSIGNAVVYILTCDGNYGCGCPGGLENAIGKVEEIPDSKRLLLYWNGINILLNLIRYEAKRKLEKDESKEYLTRITELLKNIENISEFYYENKVLKRSFIENILDRIYYEIRSIDDNCTPPPNLQQRLEGILNRLESMYSSPENIKRLKRLALKLGSDAIAGHHLNGINGVLSALGEIKDPILFQEVIKLLEKEEFIKLVKDLLPTGAVEGVILNIISAVAKELPKDVPGNYTPQNKYTIEDVVKSLIDTYKDRPYFPIALRMALAYYRLPELNPNELKLYASLMTSKPVVELFDRAYEEMGRTGIDILDNKLQPYIISIIKEYKDFYEKLDFYKRILKIENQ